MTSSADIVIIGGGIQGASLALSLAQHRAGRIVLLERKWLAGGPTAKSGAMIRPLFADQVYVELVHASTGMFERWSDEVGGDPGFVQPGFLRVTESLDQTVIGADLGLLRRLGVPVEILTSAQMRALAPFAEFSDAEKGVFLPRGGFADPQRTTVALAEAARRLGVEIVEGVAVTGIESGQGAVQAVQTDRGRIAAGLVVNCAGAWSGRVAALAGIEIPIEAIRSPTCLFQRPVILPASGPIISDGVHRVYLRAQGAELIRAAHFGWAQDPCDPDQWDESITQGQLAAIRSSLEHRYQAMKRMVSYGGFSALYDMTPDGHPIVSRFPQLTGFWCNCGWSGNGFAPAPAAGKAIAQHILTGKSDISLAAFNWPRPVGLDARADLKWIHR
jgi:sarcosine oxidase subunit beta